MAPLADVTEIAQSLALFQNPDSPATEISAFNVELDNFQKCFSGKALKTVVGRFEDPRGSVASQIAQLLAWTQGSRSPDAIYRLLNPADPALAARSFNEFEARAEHRAIDTNIIVLRYLLVDFDVVLPAGISSTDDEHACALPWAADVRDFLIGQGWPTPVSADSGNGAHLIVRLADFENTGPNVALLQNVLQTLDQLFSNDAVKIDLTTFNPARLTKVYGTIVRKGSSTPDRPHRLSRLLETPAGYHEHPVTLAQLQAFVQEYFTEPEPETASPTNSPKQASNYRTLDLDSLLQARGVQYTKRA
jgi:hypothetical protein